MGGRCTVYGSAPTESCTPRAQRTALSGSGRPRLERPTGCGSALTRWPAPSTLSTSRQKPWPARHQQSVEKPVPQFKTKTQENKTRSKFSRQNLHTESAIYSPQTFVFLLSKGKIPISPAVILIGEG